MGKKEKQKMKSIGFRAPVELVERFEDLAEHLSGDFAEVKASTLYRKALAIGLSQLESEHGTKSN